MEQSTKVNNRKDDCDDVGDRNEEPNTSKADFSDPNCAVYNTNSSKTLQALDFNSADDVRLTMKALTDVRPHHIETANQPISEELKAEVKIKSDKTDHKESEKVSDEVKNNTSKGVNRTKPAAKHKEPRRAKKRKARASKPKPAKRYKGISVQGFYWGKLSNLIFLRNSCGSDSSSEDSSYSS